MRRLAAISALLAGGLLAGCGGSGHATPSTSTRASAAAGHTSAPGATGAGTAAPAKALALAFAKAVNLRAADVRGLRAGSSHAHESAAEKRRERELLSCVGSHSSSPSGPRVLAEASSGNYERQQGLLSLGVSSEVTVARTSASAAGVLGAMHSARLRGCLSHYFSVLLHGHSFSGAKVGAVSIKQGAPPARGMTGSFGLRISAPIILHAIPIPFYIDILGFVDGPAQVSLFTYGLPRPFPAAAEEHLFSLLLARARAHRA
ncbi:MAG TPA: hypothetical protein VK790_04170 [Solirubrobacteraceae bacterium]|nr:hypothetical protein [Solirubrobacteraceae bacterium]